MAAGSWGGELVGRCDGQRDPWLVEDQEVEEADDGAGAAVGEPLVAHDVRLLERIKQQLDGALAHLAAGGQRLVGGAYDAMLAGVPLLVGELAKQRVKPDCPESAGPRGLVANSLDRAQADLEERKLAAIADRDARIRGGTVSAHRTATEAPVARGIARVAAGVRVPAMRGGGPTRPSQRGPSTVAGPGR